VERRQAFDRYGMLAGDRNLAIAVVKQAAYRVAFARSTKPFAGGNSGFGV